MTEAISGKLAELKARRPADPEFKKWMDQSDLWCWMYSLYRITGRSIARSTVATVLQGEFRDDIPLSDYAFAGNCREMYADMRGSLYMDADLDARMLSRWASCRNMTQRTRAPSSFREKYRWPELCRLKPLISPRTGPA